MLTKEDLKKILVDQLSKAVTWVIVVTLGLVVAAILLLWGWLFETVTLLRAWLFLLPAVPLIAIAVLVFVLRRERVQLRREQEKHTALEEEHAALEEKNKTLVDPATLSEALRAQVTGKPPPWAKFRKVEIDGILYTWRWEGLFTLETLEMLCPHTDCQQQLDPVHAQLPAGSALVGSGPLKGLICSNCTHIASVYAETLAAHEEQAKKRILAIARRDHHYDLTERSY